MSRSREIPQRWDRDRFERFSRGPPRSSEEDFRVTFTERERPGREEITVAERSRSRGPRDRYEERDRFYEEDRATSSRPRRRTDRELFGDVDPRELAGMAMMPYRHKSITREELDINERPPRPGITRRQSSLDTYDRRPMTYEWQESRHAPDLEVAVPVRRSRGGWEEPRYMDYYDDEDYREVEIRRERSVHKRRPGKSEAGRSTKGDSKSRHESSSSSSSTAGETAKQETTSTRSVRGGSSKARSSKARSNRATSVHESLHESVHESGGNESINESFNESVHESGTNKSGRKSSANVSLHESFHESVHESGEQGSVEQSAIEESVRQERTFKKGKTRMPKRLVRKEAIMDLGYPFDEEEDFFVLRIALEKEQIDEVIKISETYREGEKKKVYRFEESAEESSPAQTGTREEIERTEWINPPTVVGQRAKSPGVQSSVSQRLSPRQSEHHHRSRSRKASSSRTVEERKTIVEERSPPEPPNAPPLPGNYYEREDVEIREREPSRHGSALILAEREERSDKDIRAEIRRLESERRALRFEREAEEKNDMALRLRERPEDDIQIAGYREVKPRAMLEIYERDRSPQRNVVRVEKDRKERKKAKIFAAAMATLT